MGRIHREDQFVPDEICIVHTIQRCVRRAFLTGIDETTGKDYSYRQEWIRQRHEALASVFAIDVLNYAVMSNHVHSLLRNRPDVVETWSDREIATRWLKVFPGRRLDELLASPATSDVNALVANKDKMAKIRLRLSDISWYMRALCEPIARVANREDECTGHFWEGRFKANRIIDETGLLACSMYIDLNPIRAAVAESIETSKNTSAYDRLMGELGVEMNSAAFDLETVTNADAAEEMKSKSNESTRSKGSRAKNKRQNSKIRRDEWLAPVSLAHRILASDPQASKSGVRASDKGYLNIDWRAYLALLRWTAKRSQENDAPFVPPTVLETLKRLGLSGAMWRNLVWNFKKYFGRSSCTGSPDSMRADAEHRNIKFHHGQQRLRECFAS